MSKKRIYIAGPISKGDLLTNIAQGDETFRLLTLAGFAPFCPHWSCFSGAVRRGYEAVVDDKTGWVSIKDTLLGVPTQTGGLNLKHADWLGVDLAWVEVSHAVARLPGESTGADMETGHADKNSIPVFRGDPKAVTALIVDHFTPRKSIRVLSLRTIPIDATDIMLNEADGGYPNLADLNIGDRVRMENNVPFPSENYQATVVDKWSGVLDTVPAKVLAASFYEDRRSLAGVVARRRRLLYPDFNASKKVNIITVRRTA